MTLPQTLESSWVRINGDWIYGRVSRQPVAEGPAVVLVHGVGMSGRYLLPTATRLSEDYRVFVPDLPGFGNSRRSGRILSFTELTDVLAAWMNAMGLDQAVLLGNSFGCQIIVELAMRHPQRLLRAILQGPTVDPHVRTWFQQFLCWLQNAARSPPSLGMVFIRDYWDCGIRRFLRTFQEALDDPIEEKLPYVECPTLVVRGMRDPFVSQQWAEQVTHLLPQGRLRVLPGVGHPATYGAPLELVRVVGPFLEEERQLTGRRQFKKEGENTHGHRASVYREL